MSLIFWLNLPARIDDIDPVEPGSRAAMRHGRDLGRLAFSVEESTKKLVIILVTNLDAGIPKFLRVGLVSHIFKHPGNFAVLDFIEELATKLEVVALLVDGIGSSA